MSRKSSIVKKTILGEQWVQGDAEQPSRANGSFPKHLSHSDKASSAITEDALYSKFREHIQKEFQSALAAQQQSCSARAREDIQQAISALEPDLLRLALAAAEKVCHKEITDNKAIVVDVVREGLAILGRRAAATIHLHPEDLPVIEAALSTFEKGITDLTLQEDGDVERGGALIESGPHLLDARVTTRLHQLRETILDRDHA